MNENRPHSLLVDHNDRFWVESGDLAGIRDALDAECRPIRCRCVGVYQTFDEAEAARLRAVRDRVAEGLG